MSCHHSRFHRVTLVSLCFGLALQLCVPTSFARAKSKKASRLYRNARRAMYKDYRTAKSKRYRRPCLAQRKLEAYQRSLEARTMLLDGKVKAYHLRKLKSLVRYYRRQAKRQAKYAKRRCQRFWKGEAKRIGGDLRKACATRFGSTNKRKSAKLLVGGQPPVMLYLNGMLCGTSPLRVQLKPGTYRYKMLTITTKQQREGEIVLRARRSHVLIGEEALDVKGKKQAHLSLAQINQIVEHRKSAFQSCAIFQPNTNQVVLSLQINPEGRPQNVKWRQPTPAQPRFRKCILRAAQRLRFPPKPMPTSLEEYTISLN